MSIILLQGIKVNISINDDDIVIFGFILNKARILIKIKGGFVKNSLFCMKFWLISFDAEIFEESYPKYLY